MVSPIPTKVLGLSTMIVGMAIRSKSAVSQKPSVNNCWFPTWDNDIILSFWSVIERVDSNNENIVPVAIRNYGLFLFISAFFHFLVSIPKKVNTYYNLGLEQYINVFRWYEYALSSSIMMVLIAVLFGIYDLGTLILISLLNASMNLFGLLMEKMN